MTPKYLTLVARTPPGHARSLNKFSHVPAVLRAVRRRARADPLSCCFLFSFSTPRSPDPRAGARGDTAPTHFHTYALHTLARARIYRHIRLKTHTETAEQDPGERARFKMSETHLPLRWLQEAFGVSNRLKTVPTYTLHKRRSGTASCTALINGGRSCVALSKPRGL